MQTSNDSLILGIDHGYGYGLDIILLLLFLSLFVDIIVVIFSLYPLLSLRILLSFDTLGQILYGIDISSLYGLNYLCLFLSR